MNVRMAQDVLLYGVLLLAVIDDFSRMKISNRLILAGLFLSVGYRICTEGLAAVPAVLRNIFFPIFVLYIFYLLGAVGAGDIKLFSVVGGFVSFRALCLCIVMSFVIAALFSLGKMLYCRSLCSGLGRGLIYLADRLKGSDNVYERDFVKKTNLIHFSFAVLLGTAAAETYLGGLG